MATQVVVGGVYQTHCATARDCSSDCDSTKSDEAEEFKEPGKNMNAYRRCWNSHSVADQPSSAFTSKMSCFSSSIRCQRGCSEIYHLNKSQRRAVMRARGVNGEARCEHENIILHVERFGCVLARVCHLSFVTMRMMKGQMVEYKEISLFATHTY